MIVVRNVFRLKFGKAREAKALWEEARGIFKQSGAAPFRAATDLTGPFYTFVLEATHKSLADFEASTSKMMTESAEWRNWYAQFSSLVESGHREIFTLLD